MKNSANKTMHSKRYDIFGRYGFSSKYYPYYLANSRISTAIFEYLIKRGLIPDKKTGVFYADGGVAVSIRNNHYKKEYIKEHIYRHKTITKSLTFLLFYI